MLHKASSLNVFKAVLFVFIVAAGIIACNQEDQAVAPEGDDLVQTLEAISNGPVDPNFRFDVSLIKDEHTREVITGFNAAMRRLSADEAPAAAHETNAFGNRLNELRFAYRISDPELWNTLYEEGFIDAQDRDILPVLFSTRSVDKLYAMREAVLSDEGLSEEKRGRYVRGLTARMLINKDALRNGYIQTVQQFHDLESCIDEAIAFALTYYYILPDGWFDNAVRECHEMFGQ